MTENQFRDREIIPLLKSFNNSYYFIKEAVSVRGIPDIICCIDGKFVALEVKKSKSSLNHSRTKLQNYTIEKIIDANGVALFVFPENWSTVKNILCSLAGIKQP